MLLDLINNNAKPCQPVPRVRTTVTEKRNTAKKRNAATTPPRVKRKDTRPRMVKELKDNMGVNNKHWKPKTQHNINTVVRKKWDGKFYEGKITNCDVNSGFCKNEHEDGDSEDVDHHEVTRYQPVYPAFSQALDVFA